MTYSSLSHKTDLHVFHFNNPMPLGGDLDAAFSGREIVDWVGRFNIFDRFVLGNHPPSFFRVRTKLPPGEYLDAMAAMVERLKDYFSGPSFARASEGRRLLSGIECDVCLPEPGKVAFEPGEEFLARYNPDVSLIGFHFHDSLTYARRFEIAIGDLVSALEWVINSGMFVAVVHPFDVLARVYNEDRAGFERIASLARDRKFAIEINADKGFHEGALSALIENGNLFSFGGDFHALSYWLKRDMNFYPKPRGFGAGKPPGFPGPEEDKALVERVLGITREAIDKEKVYWAKLDPLFWSLPNWDEEGWALRDYAVQLYRRRRTEGSFERGLEKVLARFGREPPKLSLAKPSSAGPQGTVEECLRDLYRIHAKWGGVPRKRERIKVEKSYLLQAPLTANEHKVYERWIAKAYELGMEREQLVNTWDDGRLGKFLRK